VTYENFRTAWRDALRESGLSTISPTAVETLDTRSLDRTYAVHVEPLGGQDAPPFHVTAALSWRWDILNTARAQTCDEDVLSEMLGRDGAADLVTEKPCVLVDIKLEASAPHGKPLPLPAKSALRNWVHEMLSRLDSIEPLLPDEPLRENRMGMTEVLAWQGSPQVRTVCTPEGELLLEAVELAAGQIIELPRSLDCPDAPDEDPHAQLTDLFGRVRASLMAWMQTLDHLRSK
jgi:hypothetical protein